VYLRDWRQSVADRTISVMALEDDGPPTLFGVSRIPDCFVLKERAWCEECQEMVAEAHCPTVKHGFFCVQHCPVCK
jgi:hypothetical protein